MGLRQGENLSSLSFALFIDDLGRYISNHYKGLDAANPYGNDIFPRNLKKTSNFSL